MPYRLRAGSTALQRTGVFRSYSPDGDRFVLNDEKAGIFHEDQRSQSRVGRVRSFCASAASRTHNSSRYCCGNRKRRQAVP